jgi:hypothetical protein
MARIGEQVRQFICALHGHDSLLHFEQGRVSLMCSSCGYETPGWDVKTTSAQQKAATAAKPGVVRMRLVGARRIA